jgi:hypothetical protein
MIRKMFKKAFLLFFIVILALSPKISFSSKDDESYLLSLRYPKSYDEKQGQIGPDTRYITYKVRLLFPSKEVVRFYENKLKALGWLPFVEPNYPDFCNKKWDHFIDGTIMGEPIVHVLCTQWVNKDNSRMYGLVIRYLSTYLNERERAYAYTRKECPNNLIQEVTFQVGPFFTLPPPKPGKSD